MKVFVFGAGASLASQNNSNRIGESQKAPLVDELFKPQYWNYAEQLGFSGKDFVEYHNLVVSGNSLETILTDKWTAIAHLKNLETRKAERKDFGRISFYIWRLLQNVSKTYTVDNLYRSFLKKLRDKDEQFGIINFNYDTLLDRALQDVYGYNLTTINGYIESNYFKPHGSVNWFSRRRKNDPVIPRSEGRMDLRVRLSLASSQMFASDAPVGQPAVWAPTHDLLDDFYIIAADTFEHQYCYPLILLPLTTKLYKHFEGFRERIIVTAQNMISQASEIFFIGYRAGDEVIKEIFETARPDIPLHVVNLGNDTRKIRNDVLTWKPKLKSTQGWDAGFASFIEDYFKT